MVISSWFKVKFLKVLITFAQDIRFIVNSV